MSSELVCKIHGPYLATLIKCPYCAVTDKIPKRLQPNHPETQLVKCSHCQEMVEREDYCTNCGNRLEMEDTYMTDSDDIVAIRSSVQKINQQQVFYNNPDNTVDCPICRAHKPQKETFYCKKCQRDNICLRHQDPKKYICEECLAGKTVRLIQNEHDNENEKIFQINYQFVYPCIPKSQETLVQVVVSFTNRRDVDYSATNIRTHICLVLDVSGSMNHPKKFPLLRQAIPHLVEAMDGQDYLTIILFSKNADKVFSNTVEKCRHELDDLLTRIDNSGVMFGPNTFLAPGLQQAIKEIENYRKMDPAVVYRLYILTDGQLHDPEACYQLNSKLMTLEAEVNSYGFGDDFALDTMKRIIEGVPGGFVKPIIDTQQVTATFGHIGDLTGRIIVTDAAFQFTFASGVIPGDAFIYHPRKEYFGSVYPKKEILTKIGSLERERDYVFYYEGRLMPAESDYQNIGKACLNYTFEGKKYQLEREIFITRGNEKKINDQVNEDANNIYLILNQLRDPVNSDILLSALKARRRLAARFGDDGETEIAIRRSIHKIEQGLPLTDTDMRIAEADCQTGYVDNK